MIIIKRLTQVQTKNQSGGAFYAIALGVGILVSTLSGVIMNAIAMSKQTTQDNTVNTNYGFRRTMVMRLSPVPSRSSFSIIS